jgi:thiamine biosynthesis lipoprotein
MLRILAVGGATAASWKLGLWNGWADGPVSRTRVLMGTWVSVTVLGPDPDAARDAVEATFRRMSGLEQPLSRHREDSELSALNRTGSVGPASEALIEVLNLARRISDLGQGAFDVTVQPVLDLYQEGRLERRVPDARAIERALARVDHRAVRVAGRTVTLEGRERRITLDGVAKGYIVDRGVEQLVRLGYSDVLVVAGGDLMAAGSRSGEPWRIGIRNPRPGRALLARCEVENRALATSGDYMQPYTADRAQHHIVDPRSGRSPGELASSTVLAPDVATADALATMTLVLGSRRARELLEDLPDCEGFFVGKDLAITKTSGFPLA